MRPKRQQLRQVAGALIAGGGGGAEGSRMSHRHVRLGSDREAVTFAPPFRARISLAPRDLSPPFTRRVVCTPGSSASHLSSTARRTGLESHANVATAPPQNYAAPLPQQ